MIAFKQLLDIADDVFTADECIVPVKWDREDGFGASRWHYNRRS
jgi:hypothetical protein